jgi:hypothetical protein
MQLFENHSDQEIPGKLERFKWRKPEFEFWLATDENTEDNSLTWEWEELNNVINTVPDPKQIMLVKPHPMFELSSNVPAEWIIGKRTSQVRDLLGGISHNERAQLTTHVYNNNRIRYIRPASISIITIPNTLITTHVLFNNNNGGGSIPPGFFNPVPVPDRRTPITTEQKKRLRSDEPTPPSELKRTKEENTCKICIDNAQEVACIPCGHVCMCPTCAKEILERDSLGKKCPICREPIENIQRIVLC